MNIDQVQKIIQCPPRDRSRSRASTAATTSLKRSREADDTLSRRLKTPPVGGPGLPAWNKMTKTVSVPVLSLSKPDDSAVSTAKTTHVALTRPFTVAVAVPGTSSSTRVGNHVDDDVQHAITEGLPDLIDVDSPQEWVSSQAQNKRKRSRSGDGQAGSSRHCGQQNISSPSTSSRLEPKSPYNTRRKNGNYNSAMSTTRNASQARPATQCSGISIDDAIEVMSSASTDSSSNDSSSTDSSGVEVLEDKCIWQVDPFAQSISPSPNPQPATPPRDTNLSLSRSAIATLPGPSAASASQSRRSVVSNSSTANIASPQQTVPPPLCQAPMTTPSFAESLSSPQKSPTSSSSGPPASSSSPPDALNTIPLVAHMSSNEDNRDSAESTATPKTMRKLQRAEVKRSMMIVNADKHKSAEAESSRGNISLATTAHPTTSHSDHAVTPHQHPISPLPPKPLPVEFKVTAGDASRRGARRASQEKIDRQNQKLRTLLGMRSHVNTTGAVERKENEISDRQDTAGINNHAFPNQQTTCDSTSLAIRPQMTYNVFGDRCTPEPISKDTSTPNSTRSVVYSSEPGEMLPPIVDDGELRQSKASPSKKTSRKHEQEMTSAEPGDVFDDFADFVWTEPVTPAAEQKNTTSALPDKRPAESPGKISFSVSPSDRSDESMASEALHTSIILADDRLDVSALGSPSSATGGALTSMDTTLASPASFTKNSKVGAGGCIGPDGEEAPASIVSSGARERAMLLVAQAAQEREAMLESERHTRGKTVEVEDEEDDFALPSLDDIMGEVQTSKPSASVDHQIQAQTSLPVWPPHISAKRAPSELDRQFSAMVQQRNKEIETGTGLALFREVKSYEQRAPYPTPDLSTSPSSVKGKQLDTREESSLRQLYGGWKGFWDLSNPCVQDTFKLVTPSLKIECDAAALDKVLFGDNDVVSLAALLTHRQSFSDQDVEILETAPGRLYEDRQAGEAGKSTQQVTLWVNLLRQMFRTSGSEVIKKFLVPLVLLNVDYDTSLALRLDTMSAMAEGLARVSHDDYKSVLNDLLGQTAGYGRDLQLCIADALGRGPVMIKRFSQWYAALSLEAGTASDFLDKWTSKADIPSPTILTQHLRDRMLDLVSEDVNNALKGDATYSRSMTAFRLLAIALQDIEAILSTVVEAVQHRDPPETCKAGQKWLDETRVLLREALEAIPDERGHFTEVTLLKRHIRGLDSKLDFHGRTFMTRGRGNGLQKGTQTKLQIRRKVVT